MTMYKLTYESDEEMGAGETVKKMTPDINENTADETVIYDRSSSHEEKDGTDVKSKERSDTTASAIGSAFAATDYASGNHRENERRRNFYAMFRNVKDEDSDYPKKSSRRPWIGCKECMLIFYLLILSAGIIMMAVFFQTLSWKYSLIEERVSYLEEKVSVLSTSGFNSEIPAALQESQSTSHEEYSGKIDPRIAPPIPGDRGNPREKAGCCSRLSSRINKVEAKLSEIGIDSAMQLEKFVEFTFLEAKKNHSRLAKESKEFHKKLKVVSNQVNQLAMEMTKLHSEESEISGMASLALSQSVNGGKTKGTSDAFDAYHAKNDLVKNPQTLTYTIAPFAAVPRPLFYNYEMINRMNEMDPGSGAFRVPHSGVYMFFVSFCTAVSQGDRSTTVALMSNQTTLETFSVPVVTDLVELFRFAAPPTPVELQDVNVAENTVGEVRRHAFRVMKRLTKGQNLNLELREGSIVEQSTLNEGNTACTRFSGFRLN